MIQAVPRKGFGSAHCVQRDRCIVYIVSQSADPNPFRGTEDFREEEIFCIFVLRGGGGVPGGGQAKKLFLVL